MKWYEFTIEAYDKEELEEVRKISPDLKPKYFSARATIDLEEISSYYEDKDNMTLISMRSGEDYTVKMSYDRLKVLLMDYV